MHDYQKLALRTMADQGVILERLYKHPQRIMLMQLDNAARGMADDVGEVNSCVKKAIEYGQELDEVNLKEELGDVLWRICQACDAAGFTLEEVMEANIRKLHDKELGRYKDGYSDQAAAEENRNRAAERQALRQQTGQGWAEEQEMDLPEPVPAKKVKCYNCAYSKDQHIEFKDGKLQCPTFGVERSYFKEAVDG